MKIYLFGGAETALGEVPKELKLIEQVIKESGVTQVLHIPFARPVVHEPEWEGDWYHRYMDLPGVEYLNAENEADVARANKPLVFISGGSASGVLLDKIKANPKLLELVNYAETIVGESGGAKILGAFARVRNAQGEREVVEGLNLIPDCIIEPHFTSQNRKGVLEETMKVTKVQYGIGIDSMTAMLTQKGVLPERYQKIGSGNIFVKRKSLRIAHVISTFYPRHGGMGVVAFDEASELVARGHDVSIFTMRYGGDDKQEEKNGFKIKRLQPLFRMGDGGIVNFSGRFKQFDIVHLHLPWYGSAFLAYLSLRISKKPYVVTLHMEGSLRGLKKLYKHIADFVFLPSILKKAEKVFVVNKEYFAGARYLKKISNDKIAELSNPIDTSIFSPGEKNRSVFEELAADGTRVILFVGNLLPLKRLDVLLRVVAAGEKNWRLAVVGGGYAEAEYKAMAYNLGLGEKVKFFGSVARVELPKFYRAADCVVVPSESESFSLVAAEALSCGVPVVVSAVPGARQQVLNGAVGFEPGNVQSLVEAIRVVFTSKVVVTNAPQFSLESHVDVLESVYQS